MPIYRPDTEHKRRAVADPSKFNAAACRAARHGPARYAFDDLAGELPDRVLREIAEATE
jgi:hypothetical protein